MSLQTIGQQLNRIEHDVQVIIDNQKVLVSVPSSSLAQALEGKNTKPDIKPPIPIENFKFSNQKENSEFIDQLISRMDDKLHISTLSCLDGSDTNSDGEMIPHQIQTVHESFQNMKDMGINKLVYNDNENIHRTYYKRPTPQDLLWEENYFQNQVAYSARTIYDWNIDGLSEYQIYEIIQKMLMYSSVCKAAGNNDKDIAIFMINGFTGSLKGWWDNYLSLGQQTEILGAVKQEVTTDVTVDQASGQALPQQRTTNVPDAVYSLIQAIILRWP